MEIEVKTAELRELWRRWHEDEDQVAQERLIVAYSPLVKYVADRVGSGLPSHVDQGDLISYGLLGLMGQSSATSRSARSSLRPLRSPVFAARSSMGCERSTGFRALSARGPATLRRRTWRWKTSSRSAWWRQGPAFQIESGP